MAHPLNILLILSDQQRCDTLGVLNPRIRTPHLDRLATEGTLFTRAYPPTPICLPCRTSVLTGQYPSTTGATHNHAPLRADYAPTLSALLARRGYFTHLIGKCHFNPCHDPLSPESAPHIHDREHFRRWHGPWYGFERADISIGHTTEAHACGMHYGAWLQDHGVDTSRYFGRTEYTQYGAWDLPEEFHSSKWVADVTIESMRQCAAAGRPFFIWANLQDPHNPCMVPEPWARMYRPDELPRFGFKPGEPECFADKPPFYRETLEHPGAYKARFSDPELTVPTDTSALPWKERQVQENAACYYGMVSLLDKHVGRILEALDQSGRREDTLVVFSSDHGDMLGDHGFFWKGLHAYEEHQRVPLIARLPGRVPAGRRSAALQGLVDLAPSFLAAAGLPIPAALEGVNQWPVWTGERERARDEVVMEVRPSAAEFNQRVLITQRHKLCFYAHRPYGELYDTEADPDQVRNLWDRPEAAGLKQELSARLLSCEMNKSRPTLAQSLQAAET